jgi:glyoxylase-like metal-dependent hydrolase (beta-lactamase superfamily II)
VIVDAPSLAPLRTIESRGVRIRPGAVLTARVGTKRFQRILRAVATRVGNAVARGVRLHRAAEEMFNAMPEAEEFFRTPSEDDGFAFGLRNEYLFPSNNTQVRSVAFLSRHGAHHELRVDDDSRDLLSECGALLTRAASHSMTPGELLKACTSPAIADLARELFAQGILDDNATGTVVADMSADGIYRLQHACVLFRYGGKGILIDPHFHSSYTPSAVSDDLWRAEVNSLVDAILISHSHADHYDLTTLLSFPRHITVVVPRVPRASILCEDMASRVRSLGFKDVVIADWYSRPLILGSFVVHAMPFFGEQPLLAEWPRDPALRNWGNTYLIECGTYRAWALVDAGDDAAGRMAEVAERVVDTLGSIDAILSNLRVFTIANPLYITGDGAYWMCLSPEQIERFVSMRQDVITLGPSGVAKICRLTGASYMLPYAHWWANRGNAPDGEHRLCAELLRDLRSLGADTMIVPWMIGARFNPSGLG